METGPVVGWSLSLVTAIAQLLRRDAHEAEGADDREGGEDERDEAGENDEHVNPIPAGVQVRRLVAAQPERRHLEDHLRGEDQQEGEVYPVGHRACVLSPRTVTATAEGR